MWIRISSLLISVILISTIVCAEDFNYKKYGKSVVVTLEWGTGEKQIDGSRKDGFPPGPADLCVDDKNETICIPKSNKELLFYNMISKKNVRILMQDNAVLWEYDRNGLLYLCYWKGEKKTFITLNKDGKTTGKIKLHATIRRSEFAGGISIDEKDHIWMGQYWGPVMEFDKQGRLLKKMPEMLFGIVRSKGKYCLRKNADGNMQLTTITGRELVQLPRSAVLLGVDQKLNCYLHIYDPKTSKSHVTIVDANGLVTGQYEFDVKLAYDPDNYKQIVVGRAGDLFIVPDGSNSKRFEIVKLNP